MNENNVYKTFDTDSKEITLKFSHQLLFFNYASYEDRTHNIHVFCNHNFRALTDCTTRVPIAFSFIFLFNSLLLLKCRRLLEIELTTSAFLLMYQNASNKFNARNTCAKEETMPFFFSGFN